MLRAAELRRWWTKSESTGQRKLRVDVKNCVNISKASVDKTEVEELNMKVALFFSRLVTCLQHQQALEVIWNCVLHSLLLLYTMLLKCSNKMSHIIAF